MTDPDFTPPGPGSWELDSAHVTRPLAPYAQAALKTHLPRGFKEGTRRFGMTMSHLEPGMVNGFLYFQPVPAGRDEPGPPQWDTAEM